MKLTGKGCMELYKHYVDVIVMQKKNGRIIPLYLCWDDGQKYKIDRILCSERKVSQTGGCGIHYECVIHGVIRNLYLEKNKWFVESRHP